MGGFIIMKPVNLLILKSMVNFQRWPKRRDHQLIKVVSTNDKTPRLRE